MKKTTGFLFLLIAVLCGMVLRPQKMEAQNPATTPLFITSSNTATLSECPTSSGPGICIAGGTLYICEGGGAACYVPAASSGGVAGVTSFNGRTGAVIPTAGDYSYQMLSPGATITVSPAVTGSSVAFNAAAK